MMKALVCSLMLSASTLVVVSCESTPQTSEVAGERSGTWIDVRTPEEYESGHVEGAPNIPHDVIGEKIASVQPDKDAEIHVYCRSGRRAGIAKETLEEMGYTNVINEGGYKDVK